MRFWTPPLLATQRHRLFRAYAQSNSSSGDSSNTVEQLREELADAEERTRVLKGRCKRLYSHLIELREAAGRRSAGVAPDAYEVKKELVLRRALAAQEKRIDVLQALKAKLSEAIEITVQRQRRELQQEQRQEGAGQEPEMTTVAATSKETKTRVVTEAELLHEFSQMERSMLEKSLSQPQITAQQQQQQQQQLIEIREQSQVMKESYLEYARLEDDEKMQECEQILRKLATLEAQIVALQQEHLIEPDESQRQQASITDSIATAQGGSSANRLNEVSDGRPSSWWSDLQTRHGVRKGAGMSLPELLFAECYV